MVSHPVRLLCWVMTDPNIIHKARAVRDTWMRRCDVMLFMSSAEDKEFPTLNMNVSAGRNFIAHKSKNAWTYIRSHYFDKADYFMKVNNCLSYTGADLGEGGLG